MMPCDTLRADLLALKASSCFGAVQRPLSCPNRSLSGQVLSKEQVCPRCQLAFDRVIAFVSERVQRVASRRCHIQCRDEITSDVMCWYIERLTSGRLIHKWTPDKHPSAIASTAFLQKRIISAGRTRARLHRAETVFSVIDLKIECFCARGQDDQPSEVGLDLRGNLQPHSWTGELSVEIVAALQLLPSLASDIASNDRLVQALAAKLIPGRDDPLGYLSDYHYRKSKSVEQAVDRLVDSSTRSRSCERASQLRGEMDILRLRAQFTPLDASDLQHLLGLTRANADKRMSRYREFLADRLQLRAGGLPTQIAAETATPLTG